MARASDIIAIARKQVGVTEMPAGSNNVRYNTWYYGREVRGNGYPWCVVFVQWCADKAGVKLPKRTASCGDLMRAAQAAGQWVTGDYRPGDIAIFDFPGGAATDHCGIIESVDGGTAFTIEGNTSVGNDSNGGEVMGRTRSANLIRGAVRPVYEAEEENEVRYNTVSECPGWAQETVRKLIRNGCLSGNGKKDAQGMPTDLDLSHDMVRLLVIHDKAKLFDK